ncbi:Flagellar M-ring protein FliF [Melioribacter roseus P3M-2]|uniref:Flagellar M-ring protein n=1 Tax=Melioribacter roseus (strain DSM 23840 / JCM 17771 / VKM B-2668 / P3M-2) TaxID=1191523 RepID=I6ZTJ2_MELRP|nr:flagellar basal-body MS-ring/collar protein FliF [Melioribacter roseus]AFN75359.1 Flagellar M-ring protein FliF [Melioribacter roseus P3M-2]
MNSSPLQALFGIINKLNPKQKFMLAGGVISTVVLLIVMLFFLNEPNYTTLYTGLSAEDASKVVEYLNSQKIQYKIDDNGQTIKIAREKVYETRLALAGRGIPSSGVIGYEIFDKSTMGMSEFMQKLNYKRALEGELARTITQIDGVEGARVHIVIPQKTIFKEEEKLPSASVVLKLRNSNFIGKENIASIVNLVSSSVEGMPPGRVSIIDTKGRILSNDSEEGPLAFASTKQYEVKQSVENYLAKKAQSLLDNILGYGNSVVKVNADLNFDQVEKTMEQYDPESQVAISEQTIKSNNAGSSLKDTTVQSSENSLTNYEISKTIQKVVEGSGNIIRLSVAAVVNDIPKEIDNEGKKEIVYEPRSQEQLKKLEELVKNAVGIDPQRNDQFSLVSIPFEVKQIEEVPEEKGALGGIPNADEWMNVLIMLFAIISAIFVLKSLMKKLKNEKIIIGTVNTASAADSLALSGGSAGALSQSSAASGMMQQLAQPRKRPMLQINDIEDEISDEAVAKKTQQEKIINYVTKNPGEAAKLINAWMHEDEI